MHCAAAAGARHLAQSVTGKASPTNTVEGRATAVANPQSPLPGLSAAEWLIIPALNHHAATIFSFARLSVTVFNLDIPP
ncbi:hypothetical protein [Xanthomonas sontii]|uniref:hypothetical protein n=1 Tax=Xanthomonas sontii TaxID=2650745 RepID=UPI00123E3D10|nr:hypothetical protein [Xanthomonas sontii]